MVVPVKLPESDYQDPADPGSLDKFLSDIFNQE
jgi:hypothetical protein